MPLPPAPTKRAALLSQAAYDAPARGASRTSKRPERAPEQHPVARQVQARASEADDAEHHLQARSPALRDISARDAAARDMSARELPARAAAERAGNSPAAHHALAADKFDGSAPATNRSAQDGTLTRAAAKLKKAKSTGPTKLFVLDTNVLMHDPMCLFRFEEQPLHASSGRRSAADLAMGPRRAR